MFVDTALRGRYSFQPPFPDALGSPELAVIVPTFREAGNVGTLLDRLRSALSSIDAEIIVVDDWSDDGTADLVETIARHDRRIRLVRRYGRRGLAGAVIEGMLASVAPVVAVIDGDLQHDERVLPALYDAINRGADLAIGTRYGSGGSTGDWSPTRRAISRCATRLTGLLRCPDLSDPMSGLFAVRREVLLEAVPRLSSLGFKVLLDIALSSPRPLNIREIPFQFRCREAGESKLDGAAGVDFLLLLLDKALKGRLPPKLLLFLVVGLVGLGVNLIALDILLSSGASFRYAQAGAVMLSMLFNFAVNNELTFRDKRLRGVRWFCGLLTFSLVCGLGATANIGVGSLLYTQHHAWWVASVAGAVVAAIWNFVATSASAWNRRS